MGYIIEGYKLMAQQAGDWIVKNRANILTGVNVVGTIGTAVISHKDTIKSIRKLDEKGIKYEDLSIQDKVKNCWKDYIPTALCAVGTSAAGIGSNRVSAKNLAEMTALYTGTRKLYDNYKQASKEVLGEKKEKEVQQKVAEENIQKLTKSDILGAPHFEQGEEEGKLFVLDWLKLPFFSTHQRVELAIKQAQCDMKALPPRSRYENAIMSSDWDGKEVGVSLSQIVKYIGFDDKIANAPSLRHQGFNKGFEIDGSDDDPIEIYMVPDTAPDGEHTCWAIHFDTEPSDMRLGWRIKADCV